METLVTRYENVKAKITALNPETKLVVVSKTQSVEKIQTLYDLGERCFGESYFDEWSEKAERLPKDIEWHFIGPMQSRKVKKFKALTGTASLIQSLDRTSCLSVMNNIGQPISVLVQVNLWGESQKGGKSAEELGSFLDEIAELENVNCLGLMAIPPFTADLSETEVHFSEVRALYNKFEKQYAFDTLSIGMSSDFESAISAGATMVRVGSAIFGRRK